MTKEVIVSIKGLQFVQEENDTVELIAAGQYSFIDGMHRIEYEEIDENESGEKGITQNVILITRGMVQIMKTGMTTTQMLFEENKKNLTYYQTPFGRIMMGMDTSSIRILEEEDAIAAVLEYALEMNYNHVSDCKITIKVLSKDTQSS